MHPTRCNTSAHLHCHGKTTLQQLGHNHMCWFLLHLAAAMQKAAFAILHDECNIVILRHWGDGRDGPKQTTAAKLESGTVHSRKHLQASRSDQVYCWIDRWKARSMWAVGTYLAIALLLHYLPHMTLWRSRLHTLETASKPRQLTTQAMTASSDRCPRQEHDWPLQGTSRQDMPAIIG